MITFDSWQQQKKYGRHKNPFKEAIQGAIK